MAERTSSSTQSAIQDHGVIGDMRSAALIADTGSVDFFCWPDFDSPSIFTALLDTPEAGVFELAPVLPEARRQQIYLPDSNILQTRWIDAKSVVEITDLMPIGENVDDYPRLVRRIRSVNGTAQVRMRCRVRHDYSRADTRARLDGATVRFDANGQPGLRLASCQALQVNEDGWALCEFQLQEGQCAEFILGSEDDPLVKAGQSQRCFDNTLKYWRDWLRQSHYQGRWREMVHRSALALKLLTSRKHGGILAAATFGLPEEARRARATGITATPGSAMPRSPCMHSCAWASAKRPMTMCAGCANGSVTAARNGSTCT